MLFLQIPNYGGSLADIVQPFFNSVSSLFVPLEGFFDFDCCYYRAGQLIVFEPSLLYSDSEYQGGEFVNIPIVAWLFAPLAKLSPVTAGQIWFWLSLTAACFCIYLLQQRSSGFDLSLRWAITLAFVVSGPVVRTFNLGQSTLIVLLLLLLAENRYWHQRFTSAGVFLGLACLIKIPPLLLLPYFALRRQWEVVLAACSVGALALGGSLMLHGWQLHLEYFDTAISSVAGKSLAAHNNQSLGAGIVRLFTDFPLNPWALDLVPSEAFVVAPTYVNALVNATSFGLVLFTILTLVRGRPGRYVDSLIEIGLVMSCALLVLPVYWEHYGSWLLPIAVGLGGAFCDLSSVRVRRVAFGFLIISVLLINIPVPPMYVIEKFEANWWFRLVISHQMFGTLLLFGLCAWALRASCHQSVAYDKRSGE